MGRVRRASAQLHLGIIEGSVIMILLAILFIQYYEGYMYTTYSFEIQNINKSITFVDILGHSVILVIGSICSMSAPPLVYHAKSPISLGGRNVNIIEISLIFLVILVGLAAPIIFYHRMYTALELLAEMEKIDKYKFAFRQDLIYWTLIGNVACEILLGVWSVYEVQTPSDIEQSPIIPAKEEDDTTIIDISQGKKKKKTS